MTYTSFVLIAYSLLIMAASIGGGLFPTLVRLTHTRMQMVMSFVAGLMLGVALLHMVPHSAQLTSLTWAVEATLLGLLMMFFLIRIFHFHQHHTGDEAESDHAGHSCGHDHGSHVDPGHSHAAHSHEPELVSLQYGATPAAPNAPQEFSWIGLAFGLSLHTLIDGMALAASVAADARASTGWGLFGVGTFLAVLLHKPLDAMSITTIMEAQGWSRARQRLMNIAFALMCPLGSGLFLLSARYYVSTQPEVFGLALGFSAGVFLCISLGDLLPEVHFHTHDRGKLSFMLLLGVALAYGVGFLEPKHDNDPGSRSAEENFPNPPRRVSEGSPETMRDQQKQSLANVSE